MNPQEKKYGFQYFVSEELKSYGFNHPRSRLKTAGEIIEFTSYKYHSSKKWNNTIAMLRKRMVFEKFYTMTREFNNTRSEGDIESRVYEPTPLLNEIMNRAAARYIAKLPMKETPSYFTISVDDLLKQKPRDMVRMMNKVVGKVNNTLTVDNDPTGDGYRIYTTFNLMSRKARAMTEYTEELDVNAAIYSFMVHFVDENNIAMNIPMVRDYLKNKQQVRKLLADSIGKDVMEAKKIITAIGFGATFGRVLEEYKNNPVVVDLKKEIDDLSKAVLNNLHLIQDDKFHEYLLVKTLAKKATGKRPRTKGTRLFVFLEYYEAKMRDLLDPDGIGQPVHDAIYFMKKDILQAKARASIIEKNTGVKIG